MLPQQKSSALAINYLYSLPLVLVLLVCTIRLFPVAPESLLKRIAPFYGFCHSTSRQVSVGLTHIARCLEMAGGKDSHALIRSIVNVCHAPEFEAN